VPEKEQQEMEIAMIVFISGCSKSLTVLQKLLHLSNSLDAQKIYG